MTFKFYSQIVNLFREMIFCNITWSTSTAKKSDKEIDNWLVEIIFEFLSGIFVSLISCEVIGGKKESVIDHPIVPSDTNEKISSSIISGGSSPSVKDENR